jgi:VWFA-related protein
MRRLILLAVLAAVALPACAAKPVTVAQLEQMLAAEIAAHHADADVARKIGALDISERLTGATLDRFAARIALGPRTALALQLLSDQSSFLDPPASELPATEPPDAATQERMLDAARDYAVQTWSRLPNFFVTRSTHRFDDTPEVLRQGEWPVRVGMHPVGNTSRQITFRDGKEVEDSAAATPAAVAADAQEVGLRSWGEFGPAPTVVLSDMAKHRATFSHWEVTAGGLAAVYRYEVPREASHYAVTYSFLNQVVVGRTQFGYSGRDRSAQQVANIPRSKEVQAYSETPAYHGTVAIDPATGAVLRITIEAELSSGDPLLRAATMIEYAPVTIGERRFICPVRSLAISLEPGGMSRCAGSSQVALNGVGDDSAWQSPLGRCGKENVLLINETGFAEYHRLGSTARILTEASAAGPGAQSPANNAGTETGSEVAASSAAAPVSNPISNSASTTASTSVSTPTPTPAPTTAPVTASAPIPAVAVPDAGNAASEAPAPTPAPKPAQPVIPEVTMSAASGLPDEPADAPGPQDGNITLKLTSRLVDVGVVVVDKKGHPVRDLKQSDFEVYDNGRKQEIRFFSETTSDALAAPAAPAAGSAPEESFSNRSPDPAGLNSSPAAQEGTTTILLIDESHISWADMNNARQQMLKFLNSAAPGERIGLYTMTSLGFKVLTEITTDHAALIAHLQKWMPTAQSVSQAQDEETRNRQQFNEVHNVADLNSVNGNENDVADGAQPVDPQLLTMGDNPARASLLILGGVARHLSAVPGHKTLVWVSSDNVFADFRDQAVGIDKSSKYVDSFALHAQEAMNDAHVAVYPFDVSQLEGGAITADMQHRNVELTPAAMDAASLAPGGNSVGRNMTAGRVTAEMNEDLHPIQGPIRQVAEATGGRTIRRAGDMAGELAGVVAEGHTSYRISFSPDTIADNQYHNITVKLSGKRGLTARYRSGYLYAKEPVTLKERFQQAVWRPMDANEVAVTAGVDKMAAGANVKINVATGDLGMLEQAGRWMDRLDIFFIQRDDAGIHAQVEGQTLGLRLKPATYQNLLPAGVPFEHQVRLKPGTASLRVLVVDENSGRMGSVTIPATSLGGGH